jgi:flagellar protein FlaG
MRIEGVSTIPLSAVRKVDTNYREQTTVEQIQPEKAKERNVQDAIEKANREVAGYDRRLDFSIHEGTKQIIVKVIDTTTETVIREIPSEKILDMVEKLWELVGIIVDEKR